MVLKGLRSQRTLELLQVLLLRHPVLLINLILEVIVDLQLSLLLLLLFLGLCDLEFLVPELPELHELGVLALLGRLYLTLAVKLVLSAHVDLLLHVSNLLFFDS